MAQNKEERFEIVYSQGKVKVTQILVDRETGVHYLFHRDGYGGGLSPLLDADGRPIVTKE